MSRYASTTSVSVAKSKAKLEAVECGIVTFDQEFLAHIVGPSGRTVGEEIIPMIENNRTPRLTLNS